MDNVVKMSDWLEKKVHCDYKTKYYEQWQRIINWQFTLMAPTPQPAVVPDIFDMDITMLGGE